MRRDIYEALRRRISVVPYEEAIKDLPKMDICGNPVEYHPDVPIYQFDPSDLNGGIDSLDDRYVMAIRAPMRTKNMWNVCQRIYAFIADEIDIDNRLLTLS